MAIIFFLRMRPINMLDIYSDSLELSQRLNSICNIRRVYDENEELYSYMEKTSS